jgi:hypothetical protein
MRAAGARDEQGGGGGDDLEGRERHRGRDLGHVRSWGEQEQSDEHEKIARQRGMI